MARLTKISPYRAGAPRFGTKGHVQTWDNSVKVSYLSPEELEEYRSGRKGGSRMYTHEDYLKFQSEGLSNTEIAKKMNISQATLYNRLKVWKQQPLKSKPENEQQAETEVKPSMEKEREQGDKSGELVALIAELRAEKGNSDLRIKELEKQLQAKDEEILSLGHAVNDLERKLTLETNSSNSENIQKLKHELYEAQEMHSEVQGLLRVTDNNLQKTLDTNENLHKEILVMNNSVTRSTELLNGASDEIEKLTHKYNSLLREVGPLRQLALMKLEQDVSA